MSHSSNMTIFFLGPLRLWSHIVSNRLDSYHTFSKLECKCKLWGKRGAWATQYGVTTCCSSQTRASGSPTAKRHKRISVSDYSIIMKGSIIYSSLSCYVAMWSILTCPWNWDCLVVVVVLVFLRSSVQLDPRVFSADWLLAVIIVALLLRPLLKTRQDFIYFCWMAFFTSDLQLLHTSPPTIRVHQL